MSTEDKTTLSLVYSYLKSRCKAAADELKNAVTIDTLAQGSPSLTEVVVHYQRSRAKRKISLTSAKETASKRSKKDSSSDSNSEGTKKAVPDGVANKQNAATLGSESSSDEKMKQKPAIISVQKKVVPTEKDDVPALKSAIVHLEALLGNLVKDYRDIAKKYSELAIKIKGNK